MVFKVIFLCVMCYIGAFVDAIAGGGGLITLPSYFIAGIDTNFALGTNKFASSSGTLMSTYTFAKKGYIDKELMKRLLPFTLIGAVLGAQTVSILDPNILRPIIVFLLIAVGLYTYFAKDIGLVYNYKGFNKNNLIAGCLLALGLGFYDGFFGPGTGSFIIFGLIKLYGFDFTHASGNAKAMNLMSNVASLVVFAINGNIMYLMGVPIALSMMLGGKMGSNTALKKGSKFIKPIYIIMAFAAAIKVVLDVVLK
ncbi:MAG: TSUP family transporter [Tissierellia bacterium]|nr:TSUP family transporter [Tissierellia bacterium]